MIRHVRRTGRRGKCARDVCVYVAAKRDGTRVETPVEREEANRLHYANVVQLQLTVAKNRCRYRGMLSRSPEGVFILLFSFGSLSFSLPPFLFLFLSRSLLAPSRLARYALFLDSGYIPTE